MASKIGRKICTHVFKRVVGVLFCNQRAQYYFIGTKFCQFLWLLPANYNTSKVLSSVHDKALTKTSCHQKLTIKDQEKTTASKTEIRNSRVTRSMQIYQVTIQVTYSRFCTEVVLLSCY